MLQQTPRLINQTHARKIHEAPSLKDGSGKEIRRLHDSVPQHLRALKAMGEEPSGAFITSILELKLDQATMFRGPVRTLPVSHITKRYLSFSISDPKTCSLTQERRGGRFEHKKAYTKISAHAGNVSEPTGNCVACKVEKHPLYACLKFKSLLDDKMWSTVRSNNLCLKCFRPGHKSRNCTSLYRCKRCQKPHHTLLHVEAKEAGRNPPENLENEQSCTASIVSTNTQTGTSWNPLMMTCQVSICSRKFFNQSSRYPRFRFINIICLSTSGTVKSLQITGIGGISHNSPLHSISTFHISATFYLVKGHQSLQLLSRESLVICLYDL